jgi:hypothetical protein
MSEGLELAYTKPAARRHSTRTAIEEDVPGPLAVDFEDFDENSIEVCS